MRKLLVISFLVLTAIPAIAQETRSTIAGTVRDEQGVIPGASVKVTNVGTGATQQLTTNSSGYFEAPLLIAGTYEVVVEMTGFKTLRRTGVTLSSGQQLALPLALEIGTIAEEITVTGEAPLLEVNTLRQGLVLDEKKITELPSVEHAGAVCPVRAGHDGQRRDSVRRTGIRRRSHHERDPPRRCGWRRLVDRRRDEQRGQPADVHLAEHGHGAGDARRVHELHSINRPRTGVGISMMTKAGTNTLRGTVNHQYWTNKFNPPNRFQQVVFDRDPRAKAAYQEGLSHNLSLTAGGPVRIPGIINGTNKLFTFATTPTGRDDFNGKSANPNRTLPRSDPGHNHLAGDFSDLLLLPNPGNTKFTTR